jgi:CBS domain-containing protein
LDDCLPHVGDHFERECSSRRDGAERIAHRRVQFNAEVAMQCKDVMKQDVECVLPEDTVQAAAERMRDEHVGFLPVCDSNGRVIGTITDRDLTIRVLARGRPLSTLVDEVLTREVVACRPHDDLLLAEELMAKHHKSRMICVDDDYRLVGIISLSDIAEHEDGMNASEVLRRVSEREVRI